MSDWRKQAACREHDPEIWFPAGRYGYAYRQQVAQARAICRTCPVVQACRDDAVDTRDVHHGIRAGLTPDERRDLARPRARADHAAEAARLAAGINALPPAAWEAIRGADERGLLPSGVASEAKTALQRAGLAYPAAPPPGQRRSWVRLNKAGRALAAGGVIELTGATT